MSDGQAPDLNDPAELARYRAELRHVAYAPRMLGMSLAVVGLVFAFVRAMWWPAMPRLVPIVFIMLALALLALGIMRRTRYHMQCIRELR